MGASLADGAAGRRRGRFTSSSAPLAVCRRVSSPSPPSTGRTASWWRAPRRATGSAIRFRGLGDYNGDGIDDFLIGTPYVDGTAGTDTGAVYIVYGQTSFAANFSVSSLDGTNGQVFTGDAGDKIGEAVSGGDFNNDGADILVSAEGQDTAAMNAGGAFLIMGDVNDPPFVSEAVLATFTENIVSRAEEIEFQRFSVE